MKKVQRAMPTTYLFIYLVAAIVLHFFFPVRQIIHAPYTYCGLPLIVLGIGLNIWADGLFKKKKTAVKPFEKPSALIREGPFRFSRHPMYLGFVILLAGTATLLGSLITFLVPIAIFVTLEMLFIPHEEKQLEKTFGKRYLDYKNQVRRWL